MSPRASRVCAAGTGETVRLIGPADRDEQGNARPVVPAGLVRALLDAGARVQVAAADPGYGCALEGDSDEGEFDELAERSGSNLDGESLATRQGSSCHR